MVDILGSGEKVVDARGRGDRIAGVDTTADSLQAALKDCRLCLGTTICPKGRRVVLKQLGVVMRDDEVAGHRHCPFSEQLLTNLASRWGCERVLGMSLFPERKSNKDRKSMNVWKRYQEKLRSILIKHECGCVHCLLRKRVRGFPWLLPLHAVERVWTEFSS